MTQANAFYAALQSQPSSSSRRQPAIDVLDRFAAGVEQFYATRLTCRVVPGYPTNYGQEYRVTITSNKTRYEHTLFRAYIPLDGKNIRLDTYDYAMTVHADAAALEDQLILFLQEPSTRDALEEYAR